MSYRKILVFYAIIGLLVFGAYVKRDFLIGLAEPRPFLNFFNGQNIAVQKKIAEFRGTIDRILEKNFAEVNLDEAVPEIKTEAGQALEQSDLNEEKAAAETNLPKIKAAVKPVVAPENKIANEIIKPVIEEKPEVEPEVKPVVIEKKIVWPASLTVAGVIALTNVERAANLGSGHALAENLMLNRAAEYRLQDMFEKQYFAHESPDGLKMGYFLDKAGYDGLASGENLAEGNFAGDAELVTGWMNSSGHRANILKPTFREIGVAVGYGQFQGHSVWVAVQLFGTSTSACPGPDEELERRFNSLQADLDSLKDELAAMMAAIDSLKAKADTLEENISDLNNSGRYAQAQEKDEELTLLIEEINGQVKAYNQKVAEQKSIYTDYKESANQYNEQINEFNACINAL